MSEAARSRRDGGRHEPMLSVPGRGGDADPLAELARLVGQDDPFRDVFRPGRTSAARERAPGAFPADPQAAAYAGRSPAAPGAWPLDHGADAAPPAHHDPYDDAHGDEAYGHHQDATADHGAYYDDGTPYGEGHGVHQGEGQQPYADAAYDDDYYAAEQNAHRDDAGLGEESFEAGYPAAALADGWAAGTAPEVERGPAPLASLRPASARRPLAVLAAVLLLTGGGLAASFLAKGSSVPGAAAASHGGAPTIMAATGPTKVKVDDPSATAPEDKDAALLNKGAVVSGPVKIVTSEEQPMDLGQLPKSNLADGARPLPPPSPSPFPEPKKVKTFVVHPDGTMLSADGAVPAPAASDSEPATAAQADAAPRAAAPAGATVASLSAESAPEAAPAAATHAATGSNFGLQLASSPVQADADAAFAKLQKKYPSELRGFTATVHKAETGARPAYRVRVGGMSQEEATSLCTRLRKAGGSCYVVRD